MASKTNKKRLIIIISIECFLALIIGIVVFFIYKRHPQPEDLPKRAVLSTSSYNQDNFKVPDVQEITKTPIVLSNDKPTSTPYVTPTREPLTVCGGPPSMMILALGLDILYDNYYYGLADVIRVARVDFVSGDVTVLTFPRDLWVEIPDMEDQGITKAKLNQAYFYGSEYYGFYEGPDLGPGMMIDTLEQNYGLRIDRYITLNMAAFEKIIDAVGGIDLYLPYSVSGLSIDPDDPFDLGYFPKGDHHFDGETSIRFARIRMMDNDYYRTIRQSMVLEALWKKIISPNILPHIPQLITIMNESVQMNFKPNDIRQLVCLAPLLTDETLTFTNVPLEMLSGERVYVDRYDKTLFVYQVDEAKFDQLIRDFQNGRWP